MHMTPQPGVYSLNVQTAKHYECRRYYHGATPCTHPWDCGQTHDREEVVWTEDLHNLVMTAGKNKLLDATLKTGLSSPAWFEGLVDNAGFGAYAAGDIMSLHSGWSESVVFSNATRPAFTPGTIAAGSVDNVGNEAQFNINGSATIRGSFLADNNVKGGTTGTLYGAADFGASRAVQSGDVLKVTTTLTIS